jgi:hypothetical protein
VQAGHLEDVAHHGAGDDAGARGLGVHDHLGGWAGRGEVHRAGAGGWCPVGCAFAGVKGGRRRFEGRRCRGGPRGHRHRHRHAPAGRRRTERPLPPALRCPPPPRACLAPPSPCPPASSSSP